jgi:dGTP triphosphohydrolase
MALSEHLEKLSKQAKSVEDSVNSFNEDTAEKVTAKRAEAKKSLDETKVRIGDQMNADADDFAASWAAVQKSVSDSFDSLQDDIAKKREARAAKKAERSADDAELDAEDAVDFAIYALQEAEYAILDAAYARDEANQLQKG